MSVVRCPFCDRRYNVTGIPPSTKVLCTSCRAILTVPALRRAVRAPLWRRLVPQSSSARVAFGLVGGLVAATAAYLLVRSPAPPPAVASQAAEPVAERPGRGGAETNLWVTRSMTREEQIRRITEGIYREFGTNRFLFDVRSSSCFMLAGERNPHVTLHPMFDEFQRALESLQRQLKQEFSDPLQLGEVDEILPVVVFTSRETFDDYLRKGNNAPLPAEVPGVYEYSKRRVVFLHGRNGYPIEVVLHEAVHQIMHYYFRQRAEHGRRQSWWFQEGMATYFEQFRRGPTGNVVVDPSLTSTRVPGLKDALKRQDFPFLRDLMGMDIDELWKHWTQPVASRDEEERKMRYTQLYYGQSWALVHYLRHGAGGKYRKLFDEYFRLELRGQGGKDEFIRLLSDRFAGMELQHLERELEAHIASLP